jgi:cyanate lyase
MNLEAVRIQLIRKGMRLKDLSRMTGIDYDRLIKVLHNYRSARPDEVRSIASAVGLPESAVATGDVDRQ